MGFDKSKMDEIVKRHLDALQKQADGANERKNEMLEATEARLGHKPAMALSGGISLFSVLAQAMAAMKKLDIPEPVFKFLANEFMHAHANIGALLVLLAAENGEKAKELANTLAAMTKIEGDLIIACEKDAAELAGEIEGLLKKGGD
mgnify:CR=1 FL=1